MVDVTDEQFWAAITDECNAIRDMLLDKNRRYGNSVLKPRRTFSKADPIEQVNVRMDDKLSRIESGQEDDDEDAEMDLLGYLLLKRAIRRVRAPESPSIHAHTLYTINGNHPLTRKYNWPQTDYGDSNDSRNGN